MVELHFWTGKGKRFTRSSVIGYKWKGDQEFEVLSCGHERLCREIGTVDYSNEDWDDTELVKMLAESPWRRICTECPTLQGWK